MFKNMKVSTGLIVSFSVIIGLFLIVAVFAINRMGILADQTSELYEHPYTVSTNVLRLEADVREIHSLMKEVVTAKSDWEVETASRKVEEIHEKAMSRFAIIEERFLGDKTDVYNVKDLMEDWVDLRDEEIMLMQQDDNESHQKAYGIAKGEASELIDELLVTITALDDFAKNKAMAFNSKAADMAKKSLLFIYAILGLALLAAIILAITITGNILKQLGCEPSEAAQIANKLAKGDFTIEFDKDKNNGLYGDLKTLVEKQKEIISVIVNGANNISSSIQQVSSTSQEMSQGANQQASSVEEVSSTMEQMLANIEQNNENSAHTEKISLKAYDGIQDVNQKAQQALDANKMISEKITIINDISFQTNILALNAAVEAARAGEHGKGFAVVAAEVRKLAENSKAAAVEIVDLAQNSLVFNEEASSQLSELLPEIQKTSNLVQEISAASTEQANGASQVNNAMQQLNNVTQQNAAASEELAANNEEISGQAQQLSDVVSFFNIGREFIQPSAKKYNTTVKHLKQTHVNTNGSGIDLNLGSTGTYDDDFESF